MSNKEKVLSHLQSLGIPFEVYHHAAAHTMEDCLALPFAGEDVTFCKNILLCNRQQTAFYLYVTLPDKPFRTADVSKLLQVSRLSFAPADFLVNMLQLEPGSLSPLGLWFDPERTVTLVLDEDIRKGKRIAFHPCDNTCTVLFDQQVFWNQVLKTLGREPVRLHVPWPQLKEG